MFTEYRNERKIIRKLAIFITKQEVALALEGHWDEELLYELRNCYQLYKFLQEKVKACENKLENLLDEFTADVFVDPDMAPTKKTGEGENQPTFDLPTLSYKFYGVDLFAVESISSSTKDTYQTNNSKNIISARKTETHNIENE